MIFYFIFIILETSPRPPRISLNLGVVSTRLECAFPRSRVPPSQKLGGTLNYWSNYGVSIVSDGWTNVKGSPLINIIGVSASDVIFLSVHDYSDRYKTGINIAQPLLETIQKNGPYNVIQVIIDNVANCKAAGAIIEDKYPNTFWLGCLVHTLNPFDA